MKKRLGDCLRSDGEIVHPTFCKNERRVFLHQTCEVTCIRDCSVSSWSVWSACEQKCDTFKYKKRERVVLSNATDGGVVCDGMVLTGKALSRLYSDMVLTDESLSRLYSDMVFADESLSRLL